MNDEFIDNYVGMLREVANFERLVADLWSRGRWNTRVTQQTRDGGRDVVARSGHTAHYIEAKNWEQKVPVSMVRELQGVVSTNSDCDQGVFVTTSEFTLNAQQAAEGTDVVLFDGQALVERIDEWTDDGFIEHHLTPGQSQQSGPAAAESLDDATNIAHHWASADLAGDYHGLVRSGSYPDYWELRIEMDVGGEIVRHIIEIIKQSGEITSHRTY